MQLSGDSCKTYFQTHRRLSGSYTTNCVMKVILTCRECGYQETGRADSPLMNRIKMLNHIERQHADLHIKASQTTLVMREDADRRYEEEAYRLQASY